MSRSRLIPPFAHLNLKRNPFGELSFDEWTDVALLPLDELTGWLSQPKRCLQFLGDKGRGKTTHLITLHRRLDGFAYAHFAEDARPVLPDGSERCLDEFQRLSRFERKRVYRTSARLILGSHHDFTAELQRFDFEVRTIDLPLVWDADFLSALIQRRLERFRRGPGPLPWLARADAAGLIDRWGTNVRAILGILYEALQQQERVGRIEL